MRQMLAPRKVASAGTPLLLRRDGVPALAGVLSCRVASNGYVLRGADAHCDSASLSHPTAHQHGETKT